MSNLLHDNALVDKTGAVPRLVRELAAGRAVTAATALTRDGQAHRLLFGADGEVLDGGEHGLLEIRVRQALAALPADGSAVVWREGMPLGLLDGDEAAVYGDIDRLALERFAPGPATVDLARTLDLVLAEGRPALVVTALGPDGRCLCVPGAAPVGAVPPRAVLDAVEALGGFSLPGPTVLDVAGKRYLLDPYAPLPAFFWAGAGRISRLAAPLAEQAGFRVVVLDADPAYADRARFPGAAAVRVVPDFADCFRDEVVDEDASIVVITRGHAYDLPALAQALATPAGYVGLLACKADGRARLEELGRRGVSAEELARVRTPVGLPIGGKRPAEIALSIVAEAVAARSARRKARAKDALAAPAVPDVRGKE